MLLTLRPPSSSSPFLLFPPQLPKDSPLPVIQRSQSGYPELVNVSAQGTFDSLRCCRAGSHFQIVNWHLSSHTTATSQSFFDHFTTGHRHHHAFIICHRSPAFLSPCHDLVSTAPAPSPDASQRPITDNHRYIVAGSHIGESDH